MTALEAITPAFLRERPLPEPGDSKTTRGTALVIGGSASTPGAVVLAGLAALRVGAGVLTLAVPRAVAIPIAIAVPESGVSSWDDDDPGFSALQTRVEASSSVLIGPGLDDVDRTRRIVVATLDRLPNDCPVVLDAYALGVLPDLRTRVAELEGRLVLTPNHAEAARLLDTDADKVAAQEDVTVASQIAETWAATAIYQGIVAAPGQIPRTVATGHGGLGTSGSGDVLAGAVTGMLARGADLDRASCWATYLHAAAGDRLAARIGRLGFLARELLDELPQILSELDT
jgi:ADP-dependent NAD(P)H-hydrate dehydratase